MVHDRRVDGEPFTFGNAGGLFMNAMTWYDHKTDSIWSQPWGRAIRGSLRGVELFLLPSQITTWGSWKAEHPDTLAMTNGVGDGFFDFRQKFDPDFVIGLLLANEAKAFYYNDVEDAGIINDSFAGIPIFVWAANDNFHAYIRQVNDQTLTFDSVDGAVTDLETGSTWDVGRGLAVDGPLKGEGLQGIPSSSSYDWAWADFYPETEFYEPESCSSCQ